MAIIYKATNKITNQIYIGYTTNDLQTRINQHWSHRNSENYYFHNALKKYGKENFEWTILEECPEEIMKEREKYWIAHYDTYYNREIGYNLTPGGDGYKLSEETKAKISKANKGKTRTSEMRAHLSAVKKAQHFHHTEEAKKKMSEQRKGRKMPPEAIDKLKAIPHDKAWCEKISKALKGRHISEDTRKKISESMTERFNLYTSLGEEFHTWKEVYDFLIVNHLTESKDINPCRQSINSSINNQDLIRFGRKWSYTPFKEIKEKEERKEVSEETKQKISKANSNKNEIIIMNHKNGDSQTFLSRQEAYEYCLNNNYITNSIPYVRFSSKIGETSRKGPEYSYQKMHWIIKQKDVETIEKS